MTKLSDVLPPEDGWVGIIPPLPDWAVPCSPTPFELGLVGIQELLKEIGGEP